ncbi:FAD-dependent oxidoreductase [Mycolicibacterium austroafricanum]|uniref:ferredoxin--NADP(+) reductase n=1 Tax=Mycolicibacterium austroafricanum TaxID=39687 RepID=A0ABT8HK33_MYCAO|nr:FAD-dependent oxidoreductase [Mycolicibacterium austroafricanum]MDN4521116.1 FAD-dependent oxidoreductase [Mycolicibacterium austroafricanum]
MTYVITQSCCKDASCVAVCPVDCIGPIGAPGGSTDSEMLYIDPAACIDCGACVQECPVGAIYHQDEVPPGQQRFVDINARYFQLHPSAAGPPAPRRDHAPVLPGSLRVAIVGAGPAGCYAAGELIRIDGVQVAMFERLPTPYGLLRAGVAPDHQHTKAIADLFDTTLSHPRLQCHLNVAVGRDLTHHELLAHHHAVIYATGASTSRDLGLPGEHLPGSHTAAEFVGWYNGHPDHADAKFDLSGQRAVIIGNGNVALDIARIMLTEPDALARTDIAQHAVDGLSTSAIREVVILARRGLRDAAFSVGEFLALGDLDGVDVVIEDADLEDTPGDDAETALKVDIAREFAHRTPTPTRKRIVFRFLTTPVEIVGDTRVEALHVRGPGGHTVVIETSLLLRSIGYRSTPIPGVPFDPASGRIPHGNGRVHDHDGKPTPGIYVTGWIKRGPQGVIGTNRACAEQTVTRLWTDFDNGLLTRDIGEPTALADLLAERGVHPLSWQDWCAIEAAERQRGLHSSRPRAKFVRIADALAAAQK